MSGSRIGPRRLVLPLPRFLWHPLTATIIAAVHVYLAFEHISELLAGHVTWTHLWKGSGALEARTYLRRWRRARYRLGVDPSTTSRRRQTLRADLAGARLSGLLTL